MVIKLAELNEQLNNINDLNINFNNLLNIFKNEIYIQTELGKFILKIDISFEKNEIYKIYAFLKNEDNSIPLLEHLEPSGELCWRKGNRAECSKNNVLKSIKKILNLLTEITNHINYDNILTEFNLYLDYKDIREETNKFWIINPEFKEKNKVLVNKNIIYLNFDEPIFDESIKNLNKTDYSGIKKQEIRNIEIHISDFLRTRKIYDVLKKYKNNFVENSFHLVWIYNENKKFPIVVNYKQENFLYQSYYKIVNKNNIDMKNESYINEKININKWNFVIIGVGAIGSYLLELLSSLKPKNICVVDYDEFSFENIQRHLLDTIEIDNKLSFSNKSTLLYKRILKKFQYKIQIIEEKLSFKNIDEIISKWEDSKLLDTTIFINCTGEANITSLLFNKLSTYFSNNIYISSLFLDSEYKLINHQDMFFIKIWNNDIMKNFLDEWSSSKSTSSQYLCTSFYNFSLVDIFELITTYIRELIKICK